MDFPALIAFLSKLALHNDKPWFAEHRPTYERLRGAWLAFVGQVIAGSAQFDPSVGMEVTSYEPALLLEIQRVCPGLPADLLFPRSESWMWLDVVAYQACQQARLAQVRAVHLHPTQLSTAVVEALRGQGTQSHAWDVNAEAGLRTIAAFEIPRICTDNFRQAWAFRKLCNSAQGILHKS